MRVSARFFAIVFSLLTIAFCLLPVQAHAQQYASPDTDPNVSPTLHNYTQTVFLEVFSTIGCQLAGVDLANTKEPCLGLNPHTGKIGYVQNGGLIGTTAQLMGTLYTPPAHLSDFTRYMAQNFGFAKSAYAQGVGFGGINPVLDIWRIFRNVVYLFFVIIFVIIGFAIMLRVQIDPRTVMSIENQLPKLIVGLILVTFSFAIAGLLIDLMWVLTFLIINILTPHLQGLPVSQVNSSLFQNPFGFYNQVAPGGIVGVAAGAGGSIGDIFRSLFSSGNSARLGLLPGNTIPKCNGFDPGCWFDVGAAATGLDPRNLIPNFFGYLISFILDIVGTVVVLIAILVALFRVWFSLLLAYIYILLDVVIGPFYILLGMLPGSKINFTAWLRDLAANLISFPVIIGIFLLGRLFMESFVVNGGTSGGTERTFVPPLIGNPLSAEATTNPLGWLIGLAIVLVTPSIVQQMKELLQAPQNKLGAAVFQNLGMGGKAFGGLARNVFSTLTGNDIKYVNENGQAKMVAITGPVDKALHGFRKILSGQR